MTDYPLAIQRPGPAGKVWPDRNAQIGSILHSMQGSLAGAFSVLDDVSLTHDAYRAASWPFSIAKDGTVYQHYPIEASPFHAGSHEGNRLLTGIEHEGVPGEELTEAQFQSSYALCVWLGQQGGYRPTRDQPARTLFEHNEWISTECPSGRIPWYRYVPLVPAQQGDDVDARSLNPDDTLKVAEAEYTQFSNVQLDQHGDGKWELTGTLPKDENGTQLVVPDGGVAYLTILSRRP